MYHASNMCPVYCGSLLIGMNTYLANNERSYGYRISKQKGTLVIGKMEKYRKLGRIHKILIIPIEQLFVSSPNLIALTFIFSEFMTRDRLVHISFPTEGSKARRRIIIFFQHGLIFYAFLMFNDNFPEKNYRFTVKPGLSMLKVVVLLLMYFHYF